MRSWIVLLALGLLMSFAHVVSAQSGLTLLLHSAMAQLAVDGTANEVTLFFSLLDEGDNPIRDAQAEDFTLLEDNQVVAIEQLETVRDQPISVLLLLDTSGSMVGERIQAAREAAARFINNLQPGDSVAVMTFNARPDLQVDFTTDHRMAREVVQLVQAQPGGLTCLYDTLYQALERAARQPTNRRALILLTDGIDEAGGKPCSIYTLSDVLNLASRLPVRIPIYTIGLGWNADQQALEQLARQTQGRFQYSPGPSQLEALFGRLTDELRSQYRLTYRSTAPGGEHTLTLKVDFRGEHAEASTRVTLPALPYRLTFLSPTEGSEVQGEMLLQVQVSGQAIPPQRVLFLVNGTPLGADETPPYEISWNPAGLGEGTVLIEAVAYDVQGAELARSAVTVTYRLPPVPAEEEKTESARPLTKLLPSSLALILAAGVSLLGVVAVFALLLVRQRNRKQQREQEWQSVLGKLVTPPLAAEDRTLDGLAPSSNAKAVLIVLQSDDPTLVHQRFEITKAVTTLGRKAENDIAFPKDSPVSRQHAILEERNGLFYLSEVIRVDERGQPRRPAYGTFVNGMQVREVVRLRNGDEIQLGKRLRLRFETVRPEAESEDHTLDQFSAASDEQAFDFGR